MARPSLQFRQACAALLEAVRAAHRSSAGYGIGPRNLDEGTTPPRAKLSTEPGRRVEAKERDEASTRPRRKTGR